MSEISPYDKRELLARLLKKKDIAVSQVKRIPKRTQTDVCGLSFAQQRLWFLDQLQPASPFYSIPAAYRLLGPLDVAALEQSLNEIVRRHDALRTSVSMFDGAPVQLVSPVVPFGLPFEDLRSLPQAKREEGLRQLARANAMQGFDLLHGPLYRMSLVQMDREDHVLLLVMHHIICDGWSLAVLFKELAVLYGLYKRSGTDQTEEPSSAVASPLPDLPIQYIDYAQWQRGWLQGKVLEEQLTYWHKQLDGAPVLEMLTDRARPPVQTYRGSAHPVHIEPETTSALKELSQREGVTLFMTLLAAFQTLLYRYTGQEDICVGTPIANRNRAELEGLIGFFVNTLVLRADLSGEPTFRELLQRVREVSLDAYAHQDVPFEKLVEELQPERTLSHSPLFQVMFALQNAREDTVYLPGLTIKACGIASDTAKFDLSLLVIETGQGLKGALEYNTDLFDAPTITRLVSNFQNLLAAIVSNPDCPLRDLTLLSASERHRLLVEWNDTRKPFPREKCLHELIEEQAARTPLAPAVVCGEKMLSYGELNRRSNRLANYLQSLGVVPEVRVGIMLERSFEMVVALLGILKAGGAYVPLDPSYPRERLAFMVQDAGLAVVLTWQKLAMSLGAQGVREVCLDAEVEAIARASETTPTSGVAAENLAYVIYTSGSTGTPKGAMNTHRAICNRLLWMQDTYQLTNADRVLQKTPFSFDVSVWEFFLPLLAGARLVMACPGGHRDSEYLVNLIVEQEITTLHFVPSMLQVFLDEKAVERITLVKRVICSGEALPLELQERFFAQMGAELHNLYGPTEAAVDVTYWECRRGGNHQTVPIGRPIWNTEIYILSDRLEPVPIGVSGELYIGGEGVGRGYVKRADLTAERFLPHPFSEAGGERLYRTGDLARYLPGGEVEYLGRVDQQVKLRGYRIELGEIEAVLALHPAVGQAAVVTREFNSGDMRLVAYVVPDQERAGAVQRLLRMEKDAALNAGAVARGKVTWNSVPQLQSDLRSFLAERLPDYMMPSTFVMLPEMPSTSNGKLDRRALTTPVVTAIESAVVYAPPQTAIERMVAEVWQRVLRLEKIGLYDNFFDLGGHSLLLAQVRTNLRESHHLDVPIIEMFRYPTVNLLASYLSEKQAEEGSASKVPSHEGQPENDTYQQGQLGRRNGKKEGHRADIAIIGMAGRFPGASNISEFWHNLRHGLEAISTVSDDELRASGADEALLRDPNYVKAGSFLENIEQFDATFFGFNPREAEVTDPQHRLFLECAWEVLESAGYDPQQFAGRIGLFAGAGMNSYLLNLYSNPEIMQAVGSFQAKLGNAQDFLASRVAYKLGLRGPSVVVQSACSTSLVAVHLACQSLLNDESDMALAGGVSLLALRKAGYMYQEGGIASPDGHCRPFDAQAAGTVGGSGLGLVLLKRLPDALADHDQIHALIKGSAINNDGSLKVGYTAPSVTGQAEVIGEALAVARVPAESISYVETHGSATPMGDPVEVTALTRAFRTQTQARGFCAIGSVKSNVGHLDAAAGVTGLIKTVLALSHEELPPSLHYVEPNPAIDFASSPFYVNAQLQSWERQAGMPRRAGVSSFGIGGTNAHVVLEEAPETTPISCAPAEQKGPLTVATGKDASGDSVRRSRDSRERHWHLLMLSARSETTLDRATERLVTHLRIEGAGQELADVAFTLQRGRRHFEHRRIVVCSDTEDAIKTLEQKDPKRVLQSAQESRESLIAFMFSGLGEHYVNMGLGLYQEEPVFRAEIDHCAEVLREHLGLDIRDVIYPVEHQSEERPRDDSEVRTGLDLREMIKRNRAPSDDATQRLNQTFLTQPSVFVIEYALAKLWMSCGIFPNAMIGYSLGEYVAACLAGVLSLDDALALVAKRAQMIHELPAGGMLAVPLNEDDIRPFLGSGLSLAAVNGPSLCVAAGPPNAITELEQKLAAKEVISSRLQTSHAFHSAMMDPIAESFVSMLRAIKLNPPRIPYVSNVTGTWITAKQATDPYYWAQHLCQAVRFADGLSNLWSKQDHILLEMGPGQTLCSLAIQQASSSPKPNGVVLPTLRHSYDRQPDRALFLSSLGMLWLAGVKIDWQGFYANEHRRRVSLPTYPFERQPYWIERRRPASTEAVRQASTQKKPNAADWYYLPTWKRSKPLLGQAGSDAQGREEPVRQWLVFADEYGVGTHIAGKLKTLGQKVVIVHPGEDFQKLADNTYLLNPREQAGYEMLLKQLTATAQTPERIVHLWSFTHDWGARTGRDSFEDAQYRGFYSLLYLTQAVGACYVGDRLHLTVVSSNLHDVTGEEDLQPEKATILGLCKVIPQEYANITCRGIDFSLSPSLRMMPLRLIERFTAELLSPPSNELVAYRGHHRWEQTFEAVSLDPVRAKPTKLRNGGVYLIVGGLGKIGLTLADYLARTFSARLVLTGREGLPNPATWDDWVAAHDEQDEVYSRIVKVRELERTGAEVVVCRADASSQEQMEAVVAATHKHFGRLNGVIYVAGIVGEKTFRSIPDTGRTECDWHFRSKAHGLYVLENIVRDEKLDFCVLFSSLSSVLGGLGFAAYASANIFMDVFAQRHNRTAEVPWVSCDWDTWRIAASEKRGASAPSSLSELFMTPEEGVDAFLRILSETATQFVVSLSDLHARIDQWLTYKSAPGTEQKKAGDFVTFHPRPALRNVYIAPRNNTEETLVAIWQEVLGLEQVGIYDDFFQLGGHSLLGTQVISRVRKAFAVDLPVRAIFDAHTVADLAEAIICRRAEEIDSETFARLLADLKQLPEETELSLAMSKAEQ